MSGRKRLPSTQASSSAAAAAAKTAAAVVESVAELRRLLCVSPQEHPDRVATRNALALLSRPAAASSVTLTHIVHHDAASSPSLLYLAAAAGDEAAVSALLAAGARPLPTEDLYTAAVLGATLVRDCSDTLWLYRLLAMLHDAAVPLPPSDSACPASIACSDRGWFKCFNVMVGVDRPHIHTVLCDLSARAAADATHLSARIAAGEVHAVEAALEHLWSTMTVALPRTEHCLPRYHAVVDVHETAGTLRHVMACAHARVSTRNVISIAAAMADVDLLLSFTRAHPDAGTIDASVLYTLVSSDTVQPVDKHGNRVMDAQLALYLHQYHAAGIRMTGTTAPSNETIACAATTKVACMSVLMELFDSRARQPDAMGQTLLHFAVHGGAVCMCSHLVSQGFSPFVCSLAGVTPIDMCLQSYEKSSEFVVDMLSALLGTEHTDVRPGLLACRMFMSGFPSIRLAAALSGSDHHLGPFCANGHARVLLHLSTALRTYPAGPPRVLHDMDRLSHFEAPHIATTRNLSLDCYIDSVYVPDQLRAGADAAAGIKSAVACDAMLLMQPWLRKRYDDDAEAHGLGWRLAWHQAARHVHGTSVTLRAWAFLRRQQAIHRRRH